MWNNHLLNLSSIAHPMNIIVNINQHFLRVLLLCLLLLLCFSLIFLGFILIFIEYFLGLHYSKLLLFNFQFIIWEIHLLRNVIESFIQIWNLCCRRLNRHLSSYHFFFVLNRKYWFKMLEIAQNLLIGNCGYAGKLFLNYIEHSLVSLYLFII